MTNHFRQFVPGPENPRIQAAAGRDHHSHGAYAMDVPKMRDLITNWRERYAEPFTGVTSDGVLQEGLYQLCSEGAPVSIMVAAAQAVLETATSEEIGRLRYPIRADEWRIWSNPEWYAHPVGLRLEEIGATLRDAILALLRASLSARGYDKARACMIMNAFLGEITGAPRIMNEYSYNFSMFGSPSTESPWGWQFFGHHLVLNCFVIADQMVLSPTFMGAEPNTIDVGPYAGLTLFQEEERLGLELMRSLAPAVRGMAQIYKRQNDPAMPDWRWHFADQQIQGGAFQDNRIIPYEGVSVRLFDAAQKRQLLEVVRSFIEYLPSGPLGSRLEEIERHIDETHFSWIGGFGDEDPFYYRVQSPVILVEFDHHAGVWLTNGEPAKCHTHTQVRTPNGNDYGKDLLQQHYRLTHPGCRPGAN